MEWCLASHGGYVKVGEHEFHPAKVLTLKEGAPEKARAECREELRESDEETILAQFPSPIAVHYQRFLHGPDEALRKLSSMRDTWEGVIHLLWALAIAEMAHSGIGGQPILISEGTSSRRLRADDLRSDRLATRLSVLEALTERQRKEGRSSALSDVVPNGVIGELRRLNSVRNDFSHLATLSETQAQKMVSEFTPLLHASLVDLLGLSKIELCRLRGLKQRAGLSAEVELLIGQARSGRTKYEPLNLSSLKLNLSKVGKYDRVLARLKNTLLDLSPHFYSCADANGHGTRVLLFKKRQAGICHFEVVGESLPETSEAELHQPEFDRIQQALVNHVSGGSEE